MVLPGCIINCTKDRRVATVWDRNGEDIIEFIFLAFLNSVVCGIYEYLNRDVLPVCTPQIKI